MIKLGISNIAWPAEDNDEMLKEVRSLGCDGLEVAPSKLWREPVDSSEDERIAFRKKAEGVGLKIIALHSLLYTRPDLGLFRDKATESSTAEYMAKLAVLAADLGASVIVFGSPAGRARGKLPMDKACEMAAEFFAKPAAVAAENGVCIVIEPLSAEETDFINTAQDGLRLVQMINSPGFGLHLDAKSVYAEGPDCESVFKKMSPHIRHFHINDPGLGEVGSRAAYHESFGKMLNAAGYSGYASIEMKTLPDFRLAVRNSIAAANKNYIEEALI